MEIQNIAENPSVPVQEAKQLVADGKLVYDRDEYAKKDFWNDRFKE